MACNLSGEWLYKAAPYQDIFATEDALARDHTCMQQMCFSVGACLLTPCDSLRPKPSLPPSFDLITRGENKETGKQKLLCSYLSLEDYKLYYKSFDQTQGNCWRALSDGTAIPLSIQENLRVWEQIGFVPLNKSDEIISDYNKSYTNIIEEATA
jgi:hypothetical protein